MRYRQAHSVALALIFAFQPRYRLRSYGNAFLAAHRNALRDGDCDVLMHHSHPLNLSVLLAISLAYSGSVSIKCMETRRWLLLGHHGCVFRLQGYLTLCYECLGLANPHAFHYPGQRESIRVCCRTPG